MPSTTNNSMILARDIHKYFGTNKVLKGVSVTVNKGDVIAIIGPSGSGKSTLLRCLNHLETINSGHIDIEGETLVSTTDGIATRRTLRARRH